MDEFYHTDVGLTESDFLEETSSKSDPSIYLKVSSVLFVRAGLFLSQVSSIPSSNIQILIFQNIIDLALNTVVYALLGYLFAFGVDFGTFIGVDGFLGDKSNRSDFAEGWLIIVAVSGLVVAAVGDRISFFSSIVINVLISAVVFPLFIHWTMSEFGWMRSQSIAKVRVSYKDYSYSCLIHMSGGFLAFMSMLILNKRLLRFKDMDVCSIPDNGPSLTLFGNFFMIIGFLGIGVPTRKFILSHLDYNFYGIVMTNMLLSCFGAVIATLLLTFSCPCEPLHKWTSMRSIQAGISGIAVIAGGADVYHPIAALTVGICDGVLFFFVSFLVSISPIEDYSNVIACHFVSGLLGTLLPPVLGIREGFHGSLYYSFIHFTWQLLCDLTIISILVVIFVPITFFLDYFSILRSWDEDINHRRALFASRSKKPEDTPTNVQPQEQAANYIETDSKKPDVSESPQNVDVLYESKFSLNDTGKSMDECPEGKQEKLLFENEKYIANYMLQTRPLAFFQDISTDLWEGVPMKMKKGIRNTSDSKLLTNIKDDRPIKKKRCTWGQESGDSRTVSTVRFPSSVRISVETQV